MDIKTLHSQSSFPHYSMNGYQIIFSCLGSDSHYCLLLNYFPPQEVVVPIRENYSFSVCIIFKLLITGELSILNGEFMEKMKRRFFKKQRMMQKLEMNEY